MRINRPSLQFSSFLQSKKKIKVAVNLFFLVLAIVFSLLWYLWLYQENLVNKVGSWVISSYTEQYESEAKDVLRQLRKGEITAAVELLEEKKWREIRLLDRAFKRKREILKLLAKKLHRAERFEDLLYWSDIWRSQDERNVDAMAYWYEALYHLPDRRAEGVEGLKRLQVRFPANKLLRQFVSMIQDRKEGEIQASRVSYQYAVDILENINEWQNVTKGWEIRWQWKVRHVVSGYIHNLKQSVTDSEWGDVWKAPQELWRILLDWKNSDQLHKKGYLELSILPDLDDRIYIRAEIPRNMSTLRIDLPPNTNIRMFELNWTIDGVPEHIAPDNFEYGNLFQKEGSLESDGHLDPYFQVNLLGAEKTSESPLMVVDISFRVALVDKFGQEILLSNMLVTDPRFNTDGLK